MPTTNTNPNPHACAACKYQRRRCPPNCPLAPYFPADNPTQFFNAHKLFGVHNIVKTILKVEPDRRADAMKALIFTANARARDPVGGCYRMIRQLEAQIVQTQAQLRDVLGCIAIARAQIGLGGFDDGGGVGSSDSVLVSDQSGVGLGLSGRDDNEDNDEDGDVKPGLSLTGRFYPMIALLPSSSQFSVH
ncbi:hypothetical protein Cgig2_011451 [Carnegiea gigantea]|uniref:LOB domain-containing protein n=1 Tax=Carnegiea gigantea TaxID=171969 RepID=A0A9Q1QQP6_9CARY|nr:hypothetical protein Cgig2_011451 [Carnegiea gigantea]